MTKYDKYDWIVGGVMGGLFLILMILLICGCAAQQKLPTPSGDEQMADGGLSLIRSAGLIGIGVLVFLGISNSTKWWIAAILGVGTTVGLAITCKHYEEWFALIMFILLGAGLLMAVVSLFVKHKGIFLAWKGKK